MFREFIYFDTDRVHSIIAQLRQGLLEQVMQGNAREDSISASATANFLSLLIPFNVSGSVGRKATADSHTSKVLHDYAFNLALEALEDENLLLEADNFNPSISSMPEAAFVLVRGSAKIFDYSTFENLAKHEKDLDKLFSLEQPASNREQRRQQGRRNDNKSVFGDLKILVDAFFRDAIQIRIVNDQEVSFIGPVTRGFLREEIQNLIFKYGSKPQGEWVMLAQVTRVSSSPGDAASRLETAMNSTGGVAYENMETASDALNTVLDVMNSLQEVMSSAAYPDISVSPIAVYREIKSPG